MHLSKYVQFDKFCKIKSKRENGITLELELEIN